MKHGDMLFLQFSDRASDMPTETEPVKATAHKLSGASVPIKPSTRPPAVSADAWKTVKQHPVDDQLEKQSGKIPRTRDRMCKHGPKGMCDYCMPLEPFDATYLEEHKIKHASFHAHLKKVNSATNKPELNSSFIPPLSEPVVTVLPNCTTGHAPWPGGICSKCQPSAVTLQRQDYRMMDHLEFANPTIVDKFLDYWRKSGHQRFGFLFGTVQAYEGVPLGQKAVAQVIYEPPQACHADGIELLPWEDRALVMQVAERCNLELVGCLFTDLTDDGSGKGTVLRKRHIDSFFLSSLEAQLAALFQSEHPCKSHWAANGRYGSKFITAVVSGSPDTGAIDIAPYQISEQGVALFSAHVVEPSTDPNTILVCKEEDDAKVYIPEVFYSKVNEYGRQVKENAKPAFPMEYLLVTLTHGFPNEPQERFGATFPIEHRGAIGEAGDLAAVAKQLKLSESATQSGQASIKAIQDFHLVLYLASLDILSKQELGMLCETAATGSMEKAQGLIESGGWQTLLAILEESTGG
ncbi:NPL4 family-domain-containing protein [Protomyces lactucae-debilis]|uniref:Nuclear protein localization protein 4 n=1 Tax=Protomyces lactucae-debilis TaxID=2754530 RepID=A0A1Y2FED9_PROLT|nr:NPL4 family-domain-containing protein [Protomyces lactucae-debilis]ORY81977.1 NPL4 family-domain-containing protein [Protomyces lactucae-debilis]